MLIYTIATRLPARLQIRGVLNAVQYFRFKNTMTNNIDNSLDTFRKVCDEIANENGYKAKAAILRDFFVKGHEGTGFKGDLLLWVRMLIPSSSQLVYNLQNKQMIKLFSKIFGINADNMHESLEQDGDLSMVLSQYFQQSKKLKPQNVSKLFLQDVDEFLLKLSQMSKENDQSYLLHQLCTQATALDLKTVIRLIKQDLRINARARHILDALGPKAYEFYQSSRDLKNVVEKFNAKNALTQKISDVKKTVSKTSNVNVMTPISPMLANACKSVEEAFKKSPEGLYSEIKYDGERVQIHKKGNEFRFFSRNLKPVMEYKIKRFKEFIPKAFPSGGDMILDSEIILVDKITGDLLPFGSLGAHKKNEYASAEVCLFVFDCILFNGENIMNLEFKKRRKILEDNIKPIKSYVQLSESHFLKTKKELSVMTAKVLQANLEGVVLKNPSGIYQPGKRNWLKVKKDYLFGGQMADTADLVVLGAWFGSGKKGGVLSIFLMGCYDPRDCLWKTVTKVHSGLDDSTNAEIHQMLMQIMERPDSNKLPSWFLCNKPLVPDFIARDPLKMPVWEITGAEFTRSEAHTAAGISIRFPRITKLRDDKSAIHANDLPYLQKMYDASKKDINVDLLMTDYDENDINAVKIESKLNLKASPSKVIRATDPKNTADIKRKKEDVTVASVQSSKKICKGKDSLIKQQNHNDVIFTNSKRLPNTLLFAELTAYFDDELCETQKDIIEAYKQNGGNIGNAKASNVVFHFIPTKKITLKEARTKFNRNCHHLNVKWLKDSLNAQHCLPFEPYAMVL